MLSMTNDFQHNFIIKKYSFILRNASRNSNLYLFFFKTVFFANAGVKLVFGFIRNLVEMYNNLIISVGLALRIVLIIII